MDMMSIRLVVIWSQLGDADWLRYAIGGVEYGAQVDVIDTRSIYPLRETSALFRTADFAFAMQGLGSGAISLFVALRRNSITYRRWRAAKRLQRLLCRNLAGSDVAAMQCSARLVQDNGVDYYEIDGEEDWISNGGIADFYVVFVPYR